ncbi:MAG: cadherin repeat domain-containing protein, partial [Planctomycetaceae bacterium]|nr:cadherin repeat domain-containing protein [Planctomycetaceae bacterium]
MTAVNDAPVITSNGGGATASINVAENTATVTTVTSTDVDGGTAVYSIAGGADSAKFSINSSTGVLTFVSAPDLESPTDAGGNNVYDLTVQVSDGNGGTDAQDIAVTVTDAVDSLGITAPATATLNEDTTFVHSGANVVQVDDGITADTPIQVSLSVANGTLTLNGTT